MRGMCGAVNRTGVGWDGSMFARATFEAEVDMDSESCRDRPLSWRVAFPQSLTVELVEVG